MTERFIPYTQPGAYGITTELWRVRKNGELIKRVDPSKVGAMNIVCNDSVAVKRTATIQTDDPHHFKPFTDFLMPFMYITDPEGNTVGGPQGLYMVVPSSTSTSPTGITGSVECRDLCQLFVMSAAPGYWVNAGTDRGEAIRYWANVLGFTGAQVQIPDFGVIQEEQRVWDPGTTMMECMTDMATGSNWYQPWFNNQGKLMTSPYKQLTEVPPIHTFTNANDDDAADIEGAIIGEPDWNRLANRVIVRKLGGGDTPSIWASTSNVSPDSPSSITNLGVVITKTIDNHDLVDEAAAKAQAEQILSESSSQYMKVTLPTFPVVDAELHHTIRLEVTRGSEVIYTGTFWRTGYTLTLDGANTAMTQQLARVEEWRV